MGIILKLAFFCVFAYAMGIGFYRLYRLLNEKIISSNTVLALLGYSIILITANVLVFFGGLLLLIKAYDYVS